MTLELIKTVLGVYYHPLSMEMQLALEAVIDVPTLELEDDKTLMKVPVDKYLETARHFAAANHRNELEPAFVVGRTSMVLTDILQVVPTGRRRLPDGELHPILREPGLYDLLASLMMLAAWRVAEEDQRSGEQRGVKYLQLAHRFQHINELLPGMPEHAVSHLEMALEELFDIPDVSLTPRPQVMDDVKEYCAKEFGPFGASSPLGFFEAWGLSFKQLWRRSRHWRTLWEEVLRDQLWEGLVHLLIACLCLLIWLFMAPINGAFWLVWRPFYNACCRRQILERLLAEGKISRE